MPRAAPCAAAVLAAAVLAASVGVATAGHATPAGGPTGHVMRGGPPLVQMGHMPMAPMGGMAHMGGMAAMMREHAATLRSLRGPLLEQVFLGEMVAHHAAAVRMARVEAARGAHRDLRAMARRIIADQSREIRQMTRWLAMWHELTPNQAAARAPARLRRMDLMMAAHMRMMTARLASAPAGARLDRVFLAVMIEHHEMAVLDAAAVAGRAPRQVVDVLAGAIVSGQSAQIRQMRAWERAW